MTQHSNRDAYAPWGEPVHVQSDDWWSRLVTLPALVHHVVLMVTILAVVVTLNLLLTPGTFWALILLVVWLVVLLLHALATLGLSLLRDDDRPRTAATRAESTAAGDEDESPRPSFASWGIGRRKQDDEETPNSWELSDDASTNWPEPPASAREHAQTDSDDAADEEDAPENDSGDDRTGSWKAVTDIAWRRRSDDSATQRDTPSSSDTERSDTQ